MRLSAYVGEMGGAVSSQIEGVTHGIADAEARRWWFPKATRFSA